MDMYARYLSEQADAFFHIGILFTLLFLHWFFTLPLIIIFKRGNMWAALVKKSFSIFCRTHNSSARKLYEFLGNFHYFWLHVSTKRMKIQVHILESLRLNGNVFIGVDFGTKIF